MTRKPDNTPENREKLATYIISSMTFAELWQHVYDDIYEHYEQDDEPFYNDWDMNFPFKE